MASEEYKEYLSSIQWEFKKIQAKTEKRYECFVCFRKPPAVILELHHTTYENIYNEEMDDLRWLCSHCHSSVHVNNIKLGVEHSKNRETKRKLSSLDDALITVFNQLQEAYCEQTIY